MLGHSPSPHPFLMGGGQGHGAPSGEDMVALVLVAAALAAHVLGARARRAGRDAPPPASAPPPPPPACVSAGGSMSDLCARLATASRDSRAALDAAAASAESLLRARAEAAQLRSDLARARAETRALDEALLSAHALGASGVGAYPPLGRISRLALTLPAEAIPGTNVSLLPLNLELYLAPPPARLARGSDGRHAPGYGERHGGARPPPIVLYILDATPSLFAAAAAYAFAQAGYFSGGASENLPAASENLPAASPSASSTGGGGLLGGGVAAMAEENGGMEAEAGYRRLHIVGIGYAPGLFGLDSGGFDRLALRALRRRDLPSRERTSRAPPTAAGAGPKSPRGGVVGGMPSKNPRASPAGLTSPRGLLGGVPSKSLRASPAGPASPRGSGGGGGGGGGGGAFSPQGGGGRVAGAATAASAAVEGGRAPNPHAARLVSALATHIVPAAEAALGLRPGGGGGGGGGDGDGGGRAQHASAHRCLLGSSYAANLALQVLVAQLAPPGSGGSAKAARQPASPGHTQPGSPLRPSGAPAPRAHGGAPTTPTASAAANAAGFKLALPPADARAALPPADARTARAADSGGARPRPPQSLSPKPRAPAAARAAAVAAAFNAAGAHSPLTPPTPPRTDRDAGAAGAQPREREREGARLSQAPRPAAAARPAVRFAASSSPRKEDADGAVGGSPGRSVSEPSTSPHAQRAPAGFGVEPEPAESAQPPAQAQAQAGGEGAAARRPPPPPLAAAAGPAAGLSRWQLHRRMTQRAHRHGSAAEPPLFNSFILGSPSLPFDTELLADVREATRRAGARAASELGALVLSGALEREGGSVGATHGFGLASSPAPASVAAAASIPELAVALCEVLRVGGARVDGPHELAGEDHGTVKLPLLSRGISWLLRRAVAPPAEPPTASPTIVGGGYSESEWDDDDDDEAIASRERFARHLQSATARLSAAQAAGLAFGAEPARAAGEPS